METVYNEFGQTIGAPLPDWHGAQAPAPVILTGRYAKLEPVNAERHAADLHNAYQIKAEDQAPIWTYLAVGPFPSEQTYRTYLERIADSTDPRHFALIDLATGKPVGTIALMRIDPANGTIEVGFVVYSPLLRRTRLASEAMYLLMRHVFDDLSYRRFEWKCDALNAPSRAAAIRYGFQFEGIFRQAIVYHGRNRDTAWYSIIDSEWPALRHAYERWLAPDNFDRNGVQKQRLSALTAVQGDHRSEA